MSEPLSPSTFAVQYRHHFGSTQALQPPRLLRVFALLLCLALLLLGALLVLLPWRQTASGLGQVVSLEPTGRVQSVTAAVSGRIRHWHVHEGQAVRQGEPLVDLADNDPQYAERLAAERLAAQAALEATRAASRTARIDVDRRQRLFDRGLAAQRDVEAAQIRWQELQARVAAAQADLLKVETAISRQSTQRVLAPRDGTILRLHGGDTSTYVSAGDELVSFAPEPQQRVVELMVSGLDAALILPGQPVRLAFEGWPAVQFSGWPSVAVGTFAGVVRFVDPTAMPGGRFRLLVAETASTPWPEQRYLRLGSRARGWVLLNEVSLGYELWRQLNLFPPEPTGAREARG